MGDGISQAGVGLIGPGRGLPCTEPWKVWTTRVFTPAAFWVDVTDGLTSLTRFVLRMWGPSRELGDHFVRGHQDAPGCGHLSRLTSTVFWACCSVTDRVPCFPLQ